MLSRREAQAELRRARRISACLNKAICRSLQTGDKEDLDKVAHWQQISLKYYEAEDEKKQEVLPEQGTTKIINKTQ